jgi:hypothetical protein
MLRYAPFCTQVCSVLHEVEGFLTYTCGPFRDVCSEELKSKS